MEKSSFGDFDFSTIIPSYKQDQGTCKELAFQAFLVLANIYGMGPLILAN